MSRPVNQPVNQVESPLVRTDTTRLELNQAKHAAHKAYLTATRALDLLNKTANTAWIAHARAAQDHAWQLYQALVRETE